MQFVRLQNLIFFQGSFRVLSKFSKIAEKANKAVLLSNPT